MENSLEMLVRLLVASFLGGLIGYERFISGRAAGLRTHMLVSLGSALFMIISEQIYVPHQEGAMASTLRWDPGRIAAQIVTGIGFLGAGAIIKEGLTARGLTTAACLWVSAGLGMAAGSGLYVPAIAATGISLLSLVGLKAVETWTKSGSYRTLIIETNLEAEIGNIIDCVKRSHLRVLYCDFKKDYSANKLEIRLLIKFMTREVTDKLSGSLVKGLEKLSIKLTRVEWKH